MSTPQEHQPDQHAQRLHRFSLLLARFALIAAIPLCIAIAILFGIVFYPRGPDGTPVSEIIPVPITGLPALLFQQGPIALIGLGLLSLLLELIRRWQMRQRRKKAKVSLLPDAPPKESAVPTLAAPPAASVRKPGCWRSSISLAVISLGLALLLLCALVPLSGEVFDTSGETDLRSVAMVSANDGWAVGNFYFNVGGLRGVIWHYHDGQWALISSPTKSGLSGVTALPDGEAWAVGDGGTILHERGGAWTQVATGTTDDLRSVAMISPTEGWAVGGNYQLPTALDSNRFLVGRPARAALSSLSRLRSAEATQPGIDIDCRILHYLRGRWSPVPCSMHEPLYSVAMLPDGEAWAVGQDGIAHERLGMWEQIPSPVRQVLHSVALVSSTEGWAVGDEGVILHEQNGMWSQAPQLTSQPLYGVAVSSTGEAWSMGGDGSMLHETKGDWYADAIPAVSLDDFLFAVTLLPGGQEGWAVGADQLILHRHNGVWSLYSRQASTSG